MAEPGGRRGVKDWINLVSGAVVALTAIVGVSLLTAELRELRRQNQYLNRSLMQSYRPLGVAIQTRDDGSRKTLVIHYTPCDKKDRFSFVYQPVLTNRGQGLLSYVGHFYAISTSPKSLRATVLSGNIAGVLFDDLVAEERRQPMLAGQTSVLSVAAESLPFESKYYLSIVFLYEDQDGNLYDTEHVVHLKFRDPLVMPDGLRAKLDDGGHVTENYHLYANHERASLASHLQVSARGLADAVLDGR